MVLVSVCKDDSAKLVSVVADICVVLNDAVYARRILASECHTDIDDDDVVAVLECGHILADLEQASERNYLELILGSLGFSFLLGLVLLNLIYLLNRILLCLSGLRSLGTLLGSRRLGRLRCLLCLYVLCCFRFFLTYLFFPSHFQPTM